MAYDPGQQDPNQQNQQTQNPAIQPMTSSAPGAGPGSSAGKSAAPQATPSQPFQNLQAYLGANAPQTESQANTIAGNLTNQYGQVQSDVNNAQKDFGNQVEGGYAQANPTLTNAAAENPGAFVSTPGNMQAFQSLYNDTYGGPTSFESTTPYTNLSGEVTSAANNATNFNTLPGMQTYFQGQNPNATQGGNTLDAVLLSGNPNAMQTVQNAAKPFAGLTDYLTNATTTADQGVNQAETNAQNINQGLHNQFTDAGGVAPTFQGNVGNELQTDIGQTNAYNKSVNDLINQEGNAQAPIAGVQNAIDAYNAALKTDQNTGLYKDTNPITLKPWTNPTTIAQPTLAQAATPQDIQTQKALEQLLGSDYTPSFDSTGVTPFKNPGTAPTIQNELAPSLADLNPQVIMANPNLTPFGNKSLLTGAPVITPKVSYSQQIKDAEDALQKYLSGLS